ncbi:MAG: IS66 family insertion sequence element accessory protein TnpA [Burkholderiales bacterium]
MAGRRQGKGVQRSEHEWRSLLARFAPSESGVGAFCRREAISKASFYRWRGRLSEAPQKSLQDERSGDAGRGTKPVFIDLGALNSAPTTRPRIDLKLDLGDGLILHLVRS